VRIHAQGICVDMPQICRLVVISQQQLAVLTA